jgi:hypothetical protein
MIFYPAIGAIPNILFLRENVAPFITPYSHKINKMKLFTILGVLTIATSHCFAQTDEKAKSATTPTNKTRNNNFTLKANSLPTKLATQQTSTTGPDIKVEQFSVKHLGATTVNGAVRQNLEITCVIKNVGTTAIAATNVGMQGWVGYDPANKGGIAACGTVLSSLASDVLNPGGSFTRVYSCSVAYDTSVMAYYYITISAGGVDEANKQNNTAQASIPR